MAGTIIADRIQADTGTGSVQILSNTGTTVATFGGDGQLRFVAGSASVPAIAPAGDLNTGIFFPAADTIAFTEGGVEAMRLDSSGNLGLGATPSAWNTDYRSFGVGVNSNFYGRVTTLAETGVSANAFRNTSGNWTYLSTAAASRYEQSSGLHIWFNAASGTAGNTITFTQAMTLDASGNLAVGTSTTINARLFSYVNDASLPGLGVRQDGAGAIQVWQGAGAVERARITSTGQFLIQGTTANALLGNGVQLGTGLSSTGASAYQFLVMPNFLDNEYLSAYNIGGGNNDGRCFAAALAGRNGTGATASLCIGFNAPGGAAITGAIGTASNHPLSFGTNSAERARITSGGLFLIGSTAGSASRLEIAGTESVCIIINASATDATYKTTMAFTDSTGAVRGTIKVNNSATQYNTASDYRLKENVQPMVGALDKVALLKPCTFNWKVDGHDGQGFIAHELAEVFPDAVAGEKDAIETYTDSDGNEQTRPAYQGIDTSFLVATLTAAIQELNAKVEAQAAEIAALKGNA